MSKNQLHKEFNDVLSPQSIALNTTTIPVAGHVPPISSSRDLTIFEERLKTNLLYFRKRKRNYRIVQTLLLLISILGIYYGYFVENANYPLFTRFLSLIAFLIHFVVINRSDYRRTMNQAKTYIPSSLWIL
ncbi:hypothetical protein HMI56_001227 [Coelomomyces lativittatus]|nr:hypothetical protein HMI56_001227 [Coelomomyces lativittatus]